VLFRSSSLNIKVVTNNFTDERVTPATGKRIVQSPRREKEVVSVSNI
jgi:hypothetical protein